MEKPIEKVKDTMDVIQADIEQLNRMIVSIKDDLTAIKTYVKKQQEKQRQEELYSKRGWFY
tara:strand:+ start:929 stop:1111 length:183 start_codon:yes stop_codon:yes gene_type:complete